MRTLQKVNIPEKFAQFSDYWNPRVIGELNGQHVKAVKLKGDFVWHHHDNEDELFLVIKGIRLREEEILIGPGEFLIVPRGLEHQPYAPEESSRRPV